MAEKSSKPNSPAPEGVPSPAANPTEAAPGSTTILGENSTAPEKVAGDSEENDQDLSAPPANSDEELMGDAAAMPPPPPPPPPPPQPLAEEVEGGSERALEEEGQKDDEQQQQQPQDFEELKNVYLRKKAENALTADEELEFIRREAEENARVQALRQDGKKKRKKKNDDDGGEEAADRGRAKAKKTSKNAEEKKEKKKLEKEAKKALARSDQTTNLQSLYGTNVFAETAANEALAGQQRTFTNTGQKVNAFKQMIASVSQGAKSDAREDMKHLDDCLKDFTGRVKVSEDGTWLVNGMKSGLKHYQVLGVAFMRRREKGESEPYGGIQADEMGLGKTIMMLANVVNGLEQIAGTRYQPTLIVATPALCKQWFAEIRTHCQDRDENKKHGIGKVMMFRGRKDAEERTTEELESADIILTTYWDLSQSYPSAEVPADRTTALQKEQWWSEHFATHKGTLHKVKFHRVVLDEAHHIKNHASRTSLACRALESKYWWAMTGTPVQNTLAEFYPYFKFLRVPYTGSLRLFRQNYITDDDPDGTIRLNGVLRQIMVRRTHADTFMSARLLDLPKPHERTLRLAFSDVERKIYDVVRKRFIEKINTMSRKNELEKRYSSIHTMVLRLRQMASHILLVQQTMGDLLQEEDFLMLNKIVEDAEASGAANDGGELLLGLRNLLKQKTKSDRKEIQFGNVSGVLNEDNVPPDAAMEVEANEENLGGMHGRSAHFGRYLTSLKNSKHMDAMKAKTKCASCHHQPYKPHITSCHHIYCFECLRDLQHQAARRGLDSAKCAECSTEFTSSASVKEQLRRYAGPEEADDSEDDSELESDASSTKLGKRKSKKPAVDGEMKCWVDMKGQVYPSAKTIAIKAQIQEWLNDDPSQKIIVFTQFLPMIKILKKVCVGERWGCCQYSGAMSHIARANAIETFRSRPDKVILLASLMAGGLGLNLTMASRVLLETPFWHTAMEQQGFCRVFRIGQTQETHMVRLVINDSIDTKIEAVKARKDAEIASVMDKEQREKISALEMMSYFGTVKKDGDGLPFIVPMEDEGAERPGGQFGIDDDGDEPAYLHH